MKKLILYQIPLSEQIFSIISSVFLSGILLIGVFNFESIYEVLGCIGGILFIWLLVIFGLLIRNYICLDFEKNKIVIYNDRKMRTKFENLLDYVKSVEVVEQINQYGKKFLININITGNIYSVDYTPYGRFSSPMFGGYKRQIKRARKFAEKANKLIITKKI